MYDANATTQNEWRNVGGMNKTESVRVDAKKGNEEKLAVRSGERRE